MKTITEFHAATLKNALKTKQELTTAGKTAEELPAALGEALKLEGDKLTHMTIALELIEKKSNDLKRVVVYTLAENEKPPQGAIQKGEQVFAVEYFPPMPGTQRPGKGDSDRHGDKRGDRKGGRDGKGRGGPGGGRGGPGGDRSAGGGRGPGGPGGPGKRVEGREGGAGPGRAPREGAPGGRDGAGPGRGPREGGGPGRGPRGPRPDPTAQAAGFQPVAALTDGRAPRGAFKPRAPKPPRPPIDPNRVVALPKPLNPSAIPTPSAISASTSTAPDTASSATEAPKTE